jgi:hypothetical protein
MVANRTSFWAVGVHTLLKTWTILLLLASAPGQSGRFVPPDATVMRKLQIAPLSTGVDVAIICTKPVVPQLQRLTKPDRLVIDLPNTVVGSQSRLIPVASEDVKSVRVEQFQNKPAITRVVLDLAGNREYALESDGTRLLVHVHAQKVAQAPAPAPPVPQPPPSPPATPAMAATTPPAPAPTPVNSRITRPVGAVTVAGARVPSGSSVTAGGQTTVLQLARGGEVRVCPGTTVSVTPSKDGRDMMLAMGTGTIELDYHLPGASDTILTPDFRISLNGPGEFRYAISADSKGDTCVRGLLGNGSPATVAELIGDGTYQVKPEEQIVFRSGVLARTDTNIPLECGCPPLSAPPLLASSQLPATNPAQMALGGSSLTVVPPPPSIPSGAANAGVPPALPVATGLPPAEQAQVHVQVDTPFVYRAAPNPEVTKQASALPLQRPPIPGWKENPAAPPPKAPASTATPAKTAVSKPDQGKGFFHGLKRFFAAIFR